MGLQSEQFLGHSKSMEESMEKMEKGQNKSEGRSDHVERNLGKTIFEPREEHMEDMPAQIGKGKEIRNEDGVGSLEGYHLKANKIGLSMIGEVSSGLGS